ncbi:cache domain-containing sensor histidine kinase [Gracilibacillus alcaliphilus]|uniref:cache domain-containing sensor histidine kinase n=1 Tax=Gracilibacillus alcaliphilus TaxID=1401441 RepID=UPI001956A931|nr:sensor histidine kinase [Gracilibacillus alcaliphilus]MBM7676425.1 two-component system sensor histidine kinase YesM [Gracilibacillus alcaliphilus]
MNKLLRFFDQLNVKNKLLGIYLLVTVIPIILVGAYLNFSTRNIVLNHSLSEADSNVDKLELRFQTSLNRIINVSDMLFMNPTLKEFLENDYETTLDMYNAYQNYPIFDEYLNYYDEIATIQFFMNKEMITNSHFIQADDVVQEQAWYREARAKNGQIVWVYLEEHWTKRKSVALARTVYGTDNSNLGVLVIHLSPHILRSLVEGELYHSFITLDEEVIIYDSNKAYIGEQTNIFENNDSHNKNYVIDTTYDHKQVKIIVHDLLPTKSLYNSFQIGTVIPVEEVTKESNAAYAKGFFITLGALSVSLVLILIFTKSFHSRVNQLRRTMYQVAKGDFSITDKMKGHDEISQVYDDLTQTAASVEQIIDEVYNQKLKEEKWKRQQKEMDFKMLASQINPHFLYNTLEMIRMKSLSNGDREVAKIVKMLSKMMRSALTSTDKLLPFSNEVDLIQNYLEIQKLRFGEKIDYQLEVEDSVYSYYLLPLLIQPLVENAIIHGLEPKEGSGFVKIKISEKETYILIIVKDNGVGMPSARVNEIKGRIADEQHTSESIGLHNVHQRLRLSYGGQYGLEINSLEELGTKMILKVPKLTK